MKEKNRYNCILSNQDFQTHIQNIAANEYNRQFCKHDLSHLINVARLAYIYSLEKNLSIDKDLIYAAALLHDIGRSPQYETGKPHNIEGIKIAYTILVASGYNDNEIEMISESILKHSNIDEFDHTILSLLIAKADKDSRLCFVCKSRSQCKWEEHKKNKVLM